MSHIKSNLFQVKAFITRFSLPDSGFFFDLLDEIQNVFFFWGHQFHRMPLNICLTSQVGLDTSEVRRSFILLLLLYFDIVEL
jgi:hypothetical protein